MSTNIPRKPSLAWGVIVIFSKGLFELAMTFIGLILIGLFIFGLTVLTEIEEKWHELKAQLREKQQENSALKILNKSDYQVNTSA